MRLILATGNKGKVKEFQKLLKDHFDEVVSAKDLGMDTEVEETGETFFENALIKARHIKNQCGGDAVLSDDSGLCVSVLNGAPGVRSARYSSEATDLSNRQLLLKNLKGKSQRSAYFESCLVLISGNEEHFGEGRVEGEILQEEDGQNGFGYDNIFFCNELGKSFGKCSEMEKNSVSHRARAVENLLKKLSQFC